MNDNSDDSTTTVTTFRFASGQILPLNEDQIEKIPYLTAIVSSGDRFESTRDEDGHYKLDPHIEFEHFSFVLDSLSFHSVRQLFTCLPKQNDIIPIIALLDFVGLGPQPDPTLNEVDSIFFSTLVYSPMLEKYLQIIRPSVIQDMAVRFAIAMAKEEYDFTKRHVIDQIYWFIMFILSAHELFGPRLRYHVHQIAEHCFSLFKPSLLKRLKKLVYRTKKDTRRLILTGSDEDVDLDEENKCPLEQLWDQDNCSWEKDLFSLWGSRTLKERQELLLNRTYIDYDIFWYWKAPKEKDLLELEPVYKRVLEIMYERLQSDICQQTIVEMRARPNPYRFVRKGTNLRLFFSIFKYETLPKRIDGIFKSEPVQEEIRERILEEICVLTSKLVQRHAVLVKTIQEYEQMREPSSEAGFYSFRIFFFSPSRFLTMQEEALSLELILNKLQHGSSIVEEIHRRVLNALHEVALKQFNQWMNQQRDIDELYYQLTSWPPPEKSSSYTSKAMHQHQRIPVSKPLSKHQLKYSRR